jgi:hypothetical protein
VGVEQHHLEPVAGQSLGDPVGVQLVGEEHLDQPEACPGGQLEPLEGVPLLPEHAQVGGVAGHG